MLGPGWWRRRWPAGGGRREISVLWQRRLSSGGSRAKPRVAHPELYGSFRLSAAPSWENNSHDRSRQVRPGANIKQLVGALLGSDLWQHRAWIQMIFKSDQSPLIGSLSSPIIPSILQKSLNQTIHRSLFRQPSPSFYSNNFLDLTFDWLSSVQFRSHSEIRSKINIILQMVDLTHCSEHNLFHVFNFLGL